MQAIENTMHELKNVMAQYDSMDIWNAKIFLAVLQTGARVDF